MFTTERDNRKFGEARYLVNITLVVVISDRVSCLPKFVIVVTQALY